MSESFFLPFSFLFPAIVIFILIAIFFKSFNIKQKIITAIIVYILGIGLSILIAVLLRLEDLVYIFDMLITPIVVLYLARHLYYRPKIRNKIVRESPKIDPKRSSTHDSQKRSNLGSSLNIYICYRRKDSDNITGRIYDRLLRHYKKEFIFKDVDSIPLGVDFRSYIDEVVGKCQVLLVVIGDEWMTIKDSEGKWRLENPQDYVHIEIASALKRNIPVIPLLVEGTVMPTEKSLPPALKSLAYRHGISIRPDPDFHNDMDRLIAALDTIVYT